MSGPDVIVIGGSAGGMMALQGIFQTLDDVRDRVVCVVLHRSPEHSPLVRVLQAYTAIPIREPPTSPWTCPPGCGDGSSGRLSPSGWELQNSVAETRRHPSNCTSRVPACART